METGVVRSLQGEKEGVLGLCCYQNPESEADCSGSGSDTFYNSLTISSNIVTLSIKTLDTRSHS